MAVYALLDHTNPNIWYFVLAATKFILVLCIAQYYYFALHLSQQKR